MSHSRANMKHSNVTVLFGDITTGGTKQTLNTCIRAGKHYPINPTVEQLQG